MTPAPGPAANAHWWACAEGHVFVYGDEPWHTEQNQFALPDGSPTPTRCPADLPDGEPCLDSSHLWGPFPVAADAQATFDRWRTRTDQRAAEGRTDALALCLVRAGALSDLDVVNELYTLTWRTGDEPAAARFAELLTAATAAGDAEDGSLLARLRELASRCRDRQLTAAALDTELATLNTDWPGGRRR